MLTAGLDLPRQRAGYGTSDAVPRCADMQKEDRGRTDPAAASTVVHQEIAETARHLDRSAVQQTDSADRRTELSADRTVLAAERTYAAWVRTGLAALASGIGARALLEGIVPRWMVGVTGSALVLFSAFCFFAAIWREMRPVAPPPQPDTHRLPPALLITINGFLVVVALAALVGIWTAGASIAH